MWERKNGGNRQGGKEINLIDIHMDGGRRPQQPNSISCERSEGQRNDANVLFGSLSPVAAFVGNGVNRCEF